MYTYVHDLRLSEVHFLDNADSRAPGIMAVRHVHFLCFLLRLSRLFVLASLSSMQRRALWPAAELRDVL